MTALAGWRVLELAEGVPAMFCAKVLADLGADVVMVEPPGGHAARAAEPRRPGGPSARFVYLTTGKRSVIASGDERLRALAAGADVVVTDLDPARVDGLVAAAPDAVVVTVRPFGATGPYADRPARHLTVFHASGEGSTLPSGRAHERFPERPPIQLGSEAGYFDAGWNAAIAVLAGCLDRLRSGAGPRADVSVHESLLTLNRTRMNRFHNDGVLVGRERNRYGITGMLRCRDGWVQLVGLRDDHWDRLVAGPEGAAFRERGFATAEARAAGTDALGGVLARWCEARPKHEVARTLSAVGAAAGVFAEPPDILASEQLAHRRFFHEVGDAHGGRVTVPGAPYRLSRTPAAPGHAPAPGSSAGFGPRDAPPAGTLRGPGRLLDGVRVLDLTWAAAGPYATLLLSFLGAEVMKVESRSRLDAARRGFLTTYDGVERSPIFNELNLNKRSVEIDLKRPEGIAAVRRLLAGVDVVVDNFRPGVMKRFGLDPAALLDAHPQLVVASSSANGSTGPDAMGAGLASIFAATGGLSDQTGHPDGPPTEVGDPVDYRSGAALTVGILAALLHRARTGEGQHVDLASREVVVAGAPDALLAHAIGVPWAPRTGNRARAGGPDDVHDVYRCCDGGWVAVAAGGDGERAGLCRVLGLDATPAAGLDAAITGWTAARPAAEAADCLRAAGVPASPVLSFADLAADPHLAARGVFVDVRHPELGAQRVMGAPWRFPGWTRAVRASAPLLGADTTTILAEEAR